MLKKAKADSGGKTGGKTFEQAKDISQAVLDSSRQIWLAGLGAFSRAQEEGAKVFETLVKQGEAVESKTRRAAADTAAAASGAARTSFAEVQKNVGGTWDKLEQVFEDRVARALSKLGVSTQSDVKHLAQRVDALSATVNDLMKATDAKAPRRPPRRSSNVERMMQDGASPAAKTATQPARNATSAVDAATGTAKKTARTARAVKAASRDP